MKEKKTSLFENGLIWFGAAVSIAEILTGTYFAPLGFARGLTAIILGHIIGCTMLFLAGLMGAKRRQSAMETAKESFGSMGASFFAVLNIVQLIGWTAIMIYDGALAANSIFPAGSRMWCIIIGALIALWILIGLRHLGKVNTVAMAALFILTIILSFTVFGKGVAPQATVGTLTFGAAVELSVAMPLSWLPLISDYTKEAERPVGATAVSAITYGIVSLWMYLIGMGAALFTGESDIAQIAIKAGLGVAGLLIVVLSTVTTTYLDAYSSGVSAETITKKISGKAFSVAVSLIGTIGAICLPLHDITDFLYFIGSVFAPMIAIQIADFYILKKRNSHKKISIKNAVIWLVGFAIYRLLMKLDIAVGSTLADVVITLLLCLIVGFFEKNLRKETQNDTI